MADAATVATITTVTSFGSCVGDAQCARGVYAGVGMFIVLAVAQTGLFFAAASAAAQRRYVAFFDLIVTGDDNHYSLSRLQVYLWTVVAIVGFAAITVASGS